MTSQQKQPIYCQHPHPHSHAVQQAAQQQIQQQQQQQQMQHGHYHIQQTQPQQQNQIYQQIPAYVASINATSPPTVSANVPQSAASSIYVSSTMRRQPQPHMGSSMSSAAAAAQAHHHHHHHHPMQQQQMQQQQQQMQQQQQLQQQSQQHSHSHGGGVETIEVPNSNSIDSSMYERDKQIYKCSTLRQGGKFDPKYKPSILNCPLPEIPRDRDSSHSSVPPGQSTSKTPRKDGHHLGKDGVNSNQYSK